MTPDSLTVLDRCAPPLVIALLAAIGTLAATPAPVAAAAAGPQHLVVTLVDAVDDDRPLVVYLAVDGEAAEVSAAFAVAPAFNRRPHDVDARGLKIADGRIHGPVAVTINPDPWVPEDGRPIACRFELDLKRNGDAISGSYHGLRGGTEVRGAARGSASPAPADDADRRIRLGLPGALLKLFEARGPNWRYALDMDLILPMAGGRVRHARFETPIPDYRGYSAIVQRADLQQQGSTLSGQVEVMVDYGSQGTQRLGLPRTELHRYDLRLMVIGDAVAGRYDVAVGDRTARRVPCLGSVSYEPPPQPRCSIAWLRLHGAMRNDWPVLLNLSLAHPQKVHGFAWAPRYNHQPHGVDASGLTLDGDRLHGQVTVHISPDVYKPPEWFSMDFDLDVRIERGELVGRFSGVDDGRRREGAITGELRAKREAIVPIGQAAPASDAHADGDGDARSITGCRLQFGWSLRGGRSAPDHHLVVEVDLDAGRPTRIEPINPADRDAFKAESPSAQLTFDGDRLTGEVAFKITDGRVATGRYHYRIEAIVDGDRLIGFWRGTHNGEHILTRSAKLDGHVTTGPAPTSR